VAGEAHPAEQEATASSEPPAGGSTARRAETRAEPTAAAGPENGAGRHYSPVVLRIAAREGIDLTQVPGSGRGGRVRKQDVLAFLRRQSAPQGAPLHIESPYREEEPPPQAAEVSETAAAGAAHDAPPAAPAQEHGQGDVSEPLSRMRRSIAEHMVRSLHTAAHCTSITEADMSGVEAARRRLGLSYLPFVARCVIDALRAHPQLNATLEGQTLTRHHDVNLGIAVSLGEQGLMVPVVHRAHELSHEGLAERIADLARRARSGGLTPDEVRGGTFTITNPGGFGTLASTPIINQPQVAILDLEAVVKRAVVLTDDAGRDSIAIRPMTNLCLSWDHRALDGALAAGFLRTLRRRLEDWEPGP